MGFSGLVPRSLVPLINFPLNRKDLAESDCRWRQTEAVQEFILTIIRVTACAATFIVTANMGLTFKNCVLSMAALSLLSEGAGSMLMGAFICSYGISATGTAIASKVILSKATLKAVAIFAASYIKFNNKIDNIAGVFEKYVFEPVYNKREAAITDRFFPPKQEKPF